MLMAYILIAIAGLILGNILRAPALFAVSVVAMILFFMATLVLGWGVIDSLLFSFSFLATLQFGYLVGLLLGGLWLHLRAAYQKIWTPFQSAEHVEQNK